MWRTWLRGGDEQRKRLGRRMEIGAIVSAVLLLGAPVLLFVVWYRSRPAAGLDAVAAAWGAVALSSVILVALLVVGRWFRRLGSYSDIEDLRKAAFAYRPGGTLALRPFLNAAGQGLHPDSPLEAYEAGIEAPAFLESVSLPSFLLAVLLALTLGILAFPTERLDLAGRPSLLLGSPLVARDAVLGTPIEELGVEVRQRLID